MTIKIKEQRIALRLPDDVDATLIAATGFNLKETVRLLGNAHVAGDVAVVLLVFAEGPDIPPIGALSTDIAEVGIRQVGAQLASFLTTGTVADVIDWDSQ